MNNKKISIIVKALILGIVLAFITIVFIILVGKTYTFELKNRNGIENIEDIDIMVEDENIAKIKDKKIEDERIIITIESVSRGKTDYLQRINKDTYATDTIYVHDFGVITMNMNMGKCNGVYIIPISTIIWLAYVLYLLILSYKESVSESMYEYKNIAYLGLIFFVAGSIIVQFLTLNNYNGLISTIDTIKNLSSLSILLLPIAFIVSILVIISNISLIYKEGFNIRNVLGVILGGFICFTTVLPEILYNALNTATWIDVHNENGIGLYIYDFVEALINISVTYIECVLIGTIVLGIKSARHIPKFDKDAIIILGCQIKKDGTLTKLLQNRVDRAIEFSKMQKEKSNKEILFVPSGGKGKDEVTSEAQAMKKYMIEQGIDENRILLEDQSKNTYENIKFSNSIINEKINDAKIAFSTTNYHVLRAGSIATEQNLKYEGIGAKTKTYFWVNAFIREFIATLFSEKKKHIATIFAIILLVALMIMILYINNNS
ncbi:MAG: YdcF family protein [Clostridia bacterium]|nr:YdcF family protein [Clostridia bacterium]